MPWANQPAYAYLNDAAKCRANAAQVNGKNIFDLMRAAYPDAKDDVTALNDALIISSFAVREIKDPKDLAGVAAVYHNRYLTIIEQSVRAILASSWVRSLVDTLATQIRRRPSKWWAIWTATATKSRRTIPTTRIRRRGCRLAQLLTPTGPRLKVARRRSRSKYFYFVSDKCNVMHHARHSDFNANVVPKMNTGNC